MKKIKITKLSNPKSWTKDFIGETFEVDPANPFEMPGMGMVYWVKGRSTSFVKVDCCVVISEPNSSHIGTSKESIVSEK